MSELTLEQLQEQYNELKTKVEELEEEKHQEVKIRLLKPHEIDCRVGAVTAKGFSLLLYKDARCDMAILDEVFGVTGWKRTHKEIKGNLFCAIEIYDKKTQQWIVKEDVGIESNTEKQKGEASDSFKRAGFNVGIGRELYTSPFIWVNDTSRIYDTKRERNGKKVYALKKGEVFYVNHISYNEEREIKELSIIDKNGETVFNTKQNKEPKKQTTENTIPISETMIDNILRITDKNVEMIKNLLKPYKKKKLQDLTYDQGKEILKTLDEAGWN